MTIKGGDSPIAPKARRKLFPDPDFPQAGEPGGAFGEIAITMRDSGTTPFGKLKHPFGQPVYKTELIRRVAKETRLTQRVVSDALNATLKAITLTLKERRDVVFPGFGTFYTRIRPASQVRSFTTKKPIDIPPMRLPAFRAGKLLKQAVWSNTPKR